MGEKVCVTGGELFERIISHDSITEEQAAFFIKQVLEGVHHMHKRHVVHLDLKPENILLVSNEKDDVKLIDFGLAKKLIVGHDTTCQFGTPEFVAPEIINKQPISTGTDMWSLGIIAYILLSGLSPFVGDNDKATLLNVKKGHWDFDDEVWDSISDEAMDFISKLLVQDPSERLDASASLQHPWLEDDEMVHLKHQQSHLSTSHLKTFNSRRKWQKALTAVKSVLRIRRLYSLTSEKSSIGSGVCASPSPDNTQTVAQLEATFPTPDLEMSNEEYLDGQDSTAYEDSYHFNIKDITKSKLSRSQSLEHDADVTCQKLLDNAPEPDTSFTLKTCLPQKMYRFEIEIARGEFSVVYKCYKFNSFKEYAAKVQLRRVNSLNEYELLKELSHPRIVKLCDAFLTKIHTVLIIERCYGGTVLRYLANKSSYTEKDIAVIMKQIIDGLIYLHGNHITHGDLKHDSVLLESRRTVHVRITGFSWATKNSTEKRNYADMKNSSLEFICPEALEGEVLGKNGDIWSLAVILFTWLSGLSPFLRKTKAKTLHNISRVHYSEEWLYDNVSQRARKLIHQTLQKQPSDRLSAIGCLQHDWLVTMDNACNQHQTTTFSSGKLYTYNEKYKMRCYEQVTKEPMPMRRYTSPVAASNLLETVKEE